MTKIGWIYPSLLVSPAQFQKTSNGKARGLLSKSSLIGVRAGTSSLPPLPLLFGPKVLVDSDEDWAVDGAASASSSSMSRGRLYQYG